MIRKSVYPLSFIASLFLFSACGGGETQEAANEFPSIAVTYPNTATVEQVDDYHGTEVADPYRWLEYDTAENVMAWVKEQNEVTFGYLNQVPFRDKIKKRLTDLYDYTRYGSAFGRYVTKFKAGGKYFFTMNDGLQNQSVIYVQDGLDGEPSVFIDPNTLTEDGTAAVTLISASRDNKYLAYGVNKAGSDWQEIFVMDLETMEQTGDVIKWAKFSNVAWRADGFYYSRYPVPAKGLEYSSKNEYHKIYFHKMGTDQSADELVYEDLDNPLRYHSVDITDDEKYLLVYISQGTEGTEILCRDLAAGQTDFTKVFEGFKYNAGVIGTSDDKLIVQTDRDAGNQHIVLIDPKNASPENWEVVVPEQESLLEHASVVGGKIFANYLQDVTSHVYQYTLSGEMESEIEFPGLGTVEGFLGDEDDTETFYSFTSFTTPKSIYRYDISTGASEPFKVAAANFDPNEYETKQVFYPGKDGTQIPMFLIYKKGLEQNGQNPTLLYGYGGFNINLTPKFSSTRLVLLENGGMLAIANLRGGGEYGEEWHDAGKLERKQTVFDDCIAAAEYLISENYTNADRLALEGRSNGGLLVGAVINQRPDLFKVAYPGVGVMDMLRFHRFTVGWGWTVEYGCADTAAHFPFLYAYSPIHNIKENGEYPAVMVTTADHDDRVVPAHSFKYAATLQAKNKTNADPLLIRIDVDAGHGAGKPISKTIDEQTDFWSFMFYNMKVDPIYQDEV